MIRYVKKRIKVFLFKIKFKKKNTTILSDKVSYDFECGNGCIIGDNVCIEEMVKMGNFSYLNPGNFGIHIDSRVIIGNFCSIGPGVSIAYGNHYTNLLTTHPILYNKHYERFFSIKNKQMLTGLQDAEVFTTIGNDVWIGSNVSIKRGVNIGNGAIVAAGAVVTKDIPDYAIFGGIPAKLIRYRFSEESVNKLINSPDKWWDWTPEKISDRFELFYNVDDYIEFENSKN